MNKTILFVFAVVIALMLAVSFVAADIPEPNSHSVAGCTKIVNLDKFPDLTLIGYEQGPSYETAYKIENNQCVRSPYKFASFSIYWATKEKLSLLKNLKAEVTKATMTIEDNNGNLTLENLNITEYTGINFSSDLNLLTGTFVFGEGSVDNSNPLIKRSTEYSIAESSDGTPTLYKSKQTSDYNDGTPKKVETFNVTTPTPNPEPVIKKGFWESIACFFKRLFGGSC